MNSFSLMEIKIRQAKISDIASLLPQIMIFEEQHAVYDDGKITEKTYQRVKEETSRDIRKKKYWVAAMNHMIVGFIKAEILDTHPGMLYIDNLFVHPDHRSRGVGTNLIHFVEVIFKEKGAHKVRLYVAKQNTNAKNLYKKLGFRFNQGIWREYIKKLK